MTRHKQDIDRKARIPYGLGFALFYYRAERRKKEQNRTTRTVATRWTEYRCTQQAKQKVKSDQDGTGCSYFV